ncbi:MAG: tripartite tricarboxylate transporter TctB family protein [Pseudomonadota bacterium]
MKIKSRKDFFSGVMFLAVGIAFAWGATTYSIGEGARMGPGYFPLVLGLVMALLGAILTMTALVVETETGDPIGRWAWKPLFFIIAANLSFGILLGGLPSINVPAMGLIIAIFALVFISSLAAPTYKFVPTLFLSIALAIGSYVAFIWALKLQMQVWPTFITG